MKPPRGTIGATPLRVSRANDWLPLSGKSTLDQALDSKHQTPTTLLGWASTPTEKVIHKSIAWHRHNPVAEDHNEQ